MRATHTRSQQVNALDPDVLRATHAGGGDVDGRAASLRRQLEVVCIHAPDIVGLAIDQTGDGTLPHAAEAVAADVCCRTARQVDEGAIPGVGVRIEDRHAGRQLDGVGRGHAIGVGAHHVIALAIGQAAQRRGGLAVQALDGVGDPVTVVEVIAIGGNAGVDLLGVVVHREAVERDGAGRTVGHGLAVGKAVGGQGDGFGGSVDIADGKALETGLHLGQAAAQLDGLGVDDANKIGLAFHQAANAAGGVVQVAINDAVTRLVAMRVGKTDGVHGIGHIAAHKRIAQLDRLVVDDDDAVGLVGRQPTDGGVAIGGVDHTVTRVQAMGVDRAQGVGGVGCAIAGVDAGQRAIGQGHGAAMLGFDADRAAGLDDRGRSQCRGHQCREVGRDRGRGLDHAEVPTQREAGAACKGITIGDAGGMHRHVAGHVHLTARANLRLDGGRDGGRRQREADVAQEGDVGHIGRRIGMGHAHAVQAQATGLDVDT